MKMPEASSALPVVLVVDDEPDILENLSEWLNESGYTTLTAANGNEALAIAKRQNVDVVVTDLNMPRLSGLHLLTLIKEVNADIEVIFLTGQGTLNDAVEALRQGKAFDFFTKPLQDLETLNLSIEKALLKKNRALPHEVPRPSTPAATPEMHDIARGLTSRDRDLVQLLAQGYRAREIADKLSLSENTVRNLLSQLYGKLKVADRTQAALFCREPGFLALIG